MAGRGASRLGRGALSHEGGGGGISDGRGAPCLALLLLGLGWLVPEDLEDVLGSLGSRFRRGAELGLGLRFGSGLAPRCVDGLGWLLGGDFGFLPRCGRGFHQGGGPLRWRGDLWWGQVLGARLGGFPRGFGGGVLDEDVVVVADEGVAVVEVVESEAEQTDVGDSGGSRSAGGGRRMLGPVSNEDEGPGSGIGCVRALSLVSRVRAGAGAVGGVMCGTWWRSCVASAAQVSGLSWGGPLQLQDVWVCLLEVVKGA